MDERVVAVLVGAVRDSARPRGHSDHGGSATVTNASKGFQRVSMRRASFSKAELLQGKGSEV